MVGQHARREAGDGVALMQQGRDAQLPRLPQHREADIAARAQHHIRLKVLQDFPGAALGYDEVSGGVQVVPYILQMMAAAQVAHRQGENAVSLTGDQLHLHPALGADKEDLAPGVQLLNTFSHSNGGVDMPRRSATG